MEDRGSPSSTLHHRSSFLLKLDLREYLQRVLLKNLELVFRAQKSQTVDYWNEIIRRLAGFGANRAAGTRRLRTEEHLVDAALLDRGFQVIHVVAAGVVVKIVFQIALADVV